MAEAGKYRAIRGGWIMGNWIDEGTALALTERQAAPFVAAGLIEAADAGRGSPATARRPKVAPPATDAGA